MPWDGNNFIYSKRLLRVIAENYSCLYEGLPTRWGEAITNPWALAEYKADFDLALKSLGGGRWSGDISSFNEYNNFGWLQRIIIADIMGIDDNFLAGLGFYNIPKLKSYAYSMMVKFLNGGQNGKF